MDDDADKEQPLDKCNVIHLETLKYELVRRWVLSSYDGIEEWEKKYDIYLIDYMRVSRRRGSTNLGKPLDYILWLREHFENSEMSTLKRFVDGSSFKATSYKAYRVNGFVFCAADSESCKTTQNSGVKMKAITNFVASIRDQNPCGAKTIYYGVVKEIIELDYYDFLQAVFYCDCVRVEDKVNGCTFDTEANLTFVNLQKLKRNSKVDDEPYCLASHASQVFYCQDPTKTGWSVVIDAPKRLDKDIDAYEEPLVFETENPFTSLMMGLINENVDEDEEITKGSWIFEDNVWQIICEEYVLPEGAKRKLMKSANNLWRNGKKILRKKYDEWDTDEARKKNCPKKTRPENWMEVDPTTTRSDSFLVGYTRSDGTFPTALVAEKVVPSDQTESSNDCTSNSLGIKESKFRLLTFRDYNHFYIELKDHKKVYVALNSLQMQPFEINSKLLTFILENRSTLEEVGVLADKRLAHVDVGKVFDILGSLYFKDLDIKAVSTCSDLLIELTKMIQLASLLRFSPILNNKDIDISTIDSRGYLGAAAAFKYKKLRSLDEVFEWYKLNSPIMNSSDISLIELAQDASEPFHFLAKVISIERIDKGLTSKERDCELFSIPVTQDASASAYQLMSLMLLNIEMGELTNFLPSSENKIKDLYIFMKKGLKDYLRGKLDEDKYTIVESMLTRKLVKQLFMPLIYGKTILTMSGDIIECYGPLLQKKDCGAIAKHYYDFWNHRFPEIKFFMKMINLIGLICSALDKPVVYVTPYFTTVQDYVRSKTAEIWIYDRITKKRRTMKVVEKLHSKNQLPVYTIHDNLISSPNNLRKLLEDLTMDLGKVVKISKKDLGKYFGKILVTIFSITDPSSYFSNALFTYPSSDFSNALFTGTSSSFSNALAQVPSGGYLVDEEGFDFMMVPLLREIKAQQQNLKEYCKTYNRAKYYEDAKP
ncbi:hypothetical protein GIB67_005108 [Kingdonia uniflora]|uniref:DNA-directed RNA polymerase n=1 Tax=Kingdonia uniflora TaxID=39325 RepID=A0A7J7PCY4_9MAGN|nr:hypothetical protein GIB67_005108 [Kingdonia uniflora]